MLYFAVNFDMRAKILVGVQTNGRRGDFNRRSGIMRTLLMRKSVVISCMPISGKQAAMTQLLPHRGWACFPLLSFPYVCLASRRYA